jgi:serine/threonine protein phosphatase PrpC
VADGISTCDVGSGAVASRTACEVLAEGVGDDCSLALFPDRVTAACREAGCRLLRWAIDGGHRDRLAAGADLMGTTLTAAWVEGNEVVVANLGDSRAYLIDGTGAEQLTVDGDVGTALLASGMPPEHVRDTGAMARALREFVGGCVLDGGEPAVYARACKPALARWKLLPGDVLVLCSDGLIEEGLFLSPQELGELVRDNSELPAAALAALLVDIAESRQGVPRPAAPDGFGDNVSCIVIKVSG